MYNSHTFQDVMSSIRRVKKVSKIDSNSGIWILPMDIKSLLLTTFNTPWGRYCFIKCLSDSTKVSIFSSFTWIYILKESTILPI